MNIAVNAMPNSPERAAAARPKSPQWYCPTHHAALSESGSWLICRDGHSFLIKNGVCDFVAGATYADAFGVQWQRHRLCQLDSYNGTRMSRKRLERCLGPDLWRRLPHMEVLECGCGAGRFTEVLLERGARVTSIDLSSAVQANAQTSPPSDWHRIAQADILQLPFAPEQYDLVVCLGVLQHTPNPDEAIARLWAQVKPGGWLVIDHYTFDLSWYTKTAPLFRAWLRRMPAGESMRWTDRLVKYLLPLHRAVRNVPLAQKFVSRISPVLSYYHVCPELPDELQYEFALLDTHDSLTDWYKHRRSAGRIRKLLTRLGGDEISSTYAGIGVEARATKPSRHGLG
jgi:SAM-dependent methyltransferase